MNYRDLCNSIKLNPVNSMVNNKIPEVRDVDLLNLK